MTANRWAVLADAINTALEQKADPYSYDAGHYGKRDWALIKVLEALRDAAIERAAESSPEGA